MSQMGFQVLMIGPRRAGKSSVLSSMLKSIELLNRETGFQFVPKPGTDKVMRDKLSDLSQLFVLHASDPDTPFSTLMGEEAGAAYSPFTGDETLYSFEFYATDAGRKKVSKEKYDVDFIDIPGEHMLKDLNQSGNSVIERYIQSDVVIVAIDTPALMEGRVKDGVGEFHTLVNIPDSVYNVIQEGDLKWRERFSEKKLLPKLILFVPIKCEKYYHARRMSEVETRIRTGYRTTLEYLNKPEYTVAITPILTLGDIVFAGYGTRINKKGKAVVEMLKPGDASGLEYMPAYPLYKLRDASCVTLNPRFCEQPMLFISGFIISRQKKLMKQAKKQARKAQDDNKLKQAFFHAFMIFMFGINYLAFKGIQFVMQMFKDHTMLDCIEKMCRYIKIDGDGYALVQDNLGIGDLARAYTQKK